MELEKIKNLNKDIEIIGDGTSIIEMSFDENGLLLRTSQEIEPRDMYDSFKNKNH